VILSDDVNDESIDDRMECDGDYMNPREGDSENAEDTMSDNNCCNEMDSTDSCFHRKGKDEVGQGKKFYTYSMQMAEYSIKIYLRLLTKQGMPLCSLKHGTVMTDEILDSIFQHTNQYIIIQPNFDPKSDAKLTDKTELKAFISLLCLAEHLRVTSRVWKNCGVLREMASKYFAQ
jgi:hypothetical protein